MIPKIDTLKIGQPAQRALQEAGIDSLVRLCDYTEQELLQLHGIGPKAIRVLREIMTKEGLSYRQP